ncbi:Aste57867_13503 [Aphanomyces stellatus]|uniref:Aste57867_13503 protein n=1 Tax=Aphanomyces stellatus TaxID=120398 RepID=A0A485KYA9_9STRA|nr:hypothetical protein As57867_013453 [Aphanomyces stellatus]VFT90341.1 Aste57867_13503 [Aphanomyces stellatus]
MPRSNVVPRSYFVAQKRLALVLLQYKSQRETSRELKIRKPTLGDWLCDMNVNLAFDGNLLSRRMTPPGRSEEFPDSKGLVAYMIAIRFKERALTCTGIINWIKKNQRQRLTEYLAPKTAGCRYSTLLRLLERFCHRHCYSQQRAVQHDNAKAHVTVDDVELLQEFDVYKKYGWSFELSPHPPNSPDLNVLDLGFFASLQSLQYRQSARSMDELIANVVAAFNEYPFTCESSGDNTYDIPHMLKAKRAAKGLLPRNTSCPLDVRAAGVALLASSDAKNLDRLFALAHELKDLKAMNELAVELENISLADADDDMTRALNDLVIDAIHITEAE